MDNIETDRNGWLPGGDILNATRAGGYLYAPNVTHALNWNKVTLHTPNAVFLRGTHHSYLNKGFSKVQADMRGPFPVDLLTNFKVAETRVSHPFTLTFTFYNEDSNIIKTVTVTGNHNYDGNGNDVFDDISITGNYDLNGNYIGYTDTEVGVSILKEMFNNQINIVDISNPFTVAAIGYGFITGNKTAQGTIGGAVVGTSTSMFSKAIVGAIGITGPAALVTGVIVGSTIGELIEMAAGYDRYFGFGGELIGTRDGKNLRSDFSNGLYGREKTVLGYIGESLGIIDKDLVKDSEVFDYDGNSLGYSFDEGRTIQDSIVGTDEDYLDQTYGISEEESDDFWNTSGDEITEELENENKVIDDTLQEQSEKEEDNNNDNGFDNDDGASSEYLGSELDTDGWGE